MDSNNRCPSSGLTRLLLLATLLCGIFSSTVHAAFPGGFLEQPATAQARPRLTLSQIQSFLPARGPFTFPAPYNTKAVRITNASDCGGADCIWSVGYSYWRNTNNHVGSDTMYIFLGLNRNRGGSGPTLFSYNKVTDEVRNLGPLFDATNPLGWLSGEGWYFSATQPTKLYLNDGPRMLRYDVVTHQSQVVYDITSQFGTGYGIWQMHSSNDDRVHSATLRNASTGVFLGCVVYHEDTTRFQYFPAIGAFDECNLDHSGRWLMSLEQTQGASYGLDMRIFDLASGANTLTAGVSPLTASGAALLTSASNLLASGVERRVLDQNGGVGHADMGHGYILGVDNWASQSNAIRHWDLTQPSLSGKLIFYSSSWGAPASDHISHTNAQAGVTAAQQYACGSSASSTQASWSNEIICYRPDGSFNTLVVAPVMTEMNSTVGGDDYTKTPKGNLDVTGQYFIWASNTGGSRVDAYIVKVPGQLLGGSSGGVVSDTTRPTVTLTAPADGSTVSGTVTVSATAADNVGVAGVQFQLDGITLGAEDTSAPYSLAWNTTSAIAGVHTLTAIARDAAGNTVQSNPVFVTVPGGDVAVPVVSSVTASNISASGATATWATNEACDSQVEYGPTSAYGSMTALNSSMVTAHSTTLSGLASNTLYHYRVRSRDATGNLALSSDASFRTSPASSGTQSVVWINAVNVTVTGNSLKKTAGCDGCQDAGAVSQQQIASGNGYFEFTVSETNLVRYVGLNNNSTGTTAAEIPFAFKLVNGYAEVREKGVYRSDTPIVTGDVLRISVQSGVVKYAKNGTVYYTSSVAPVYPLRADTSLSSFAATVANAVISTGVQNVVWTSAVNVTVTGNSLKKTAGCAGCQDAGAISSQRISSGNGYLQFTVSETNLVRYAGLNNYNTGTSAAEIPFAFKLVNGYAEVREKGVYRSDTPIVTGNVLRIEVKNGLIKYSKNGTVFYTSSVAPVYPLRADTSLSSFGATITNAVMATGP